MAARKWTFVVVLFLVRAAVTSSKWRTTKEDGVLTVWDVVVEMETDLAYLSYLNYERVILKNSKINTLTTEMQAQIQNVSSLLLEQGFVPTVHVAPHFQDFAVLHCDTTDVIINPNLTYAIEGLYILSNQLKKLPKNLNAMKNLSELDLRGNQIEYVDMADFNGLNKLQKITLSVNGIFEISANPVALPSLLFFDASYNRLSYINFEHWSATLLESILLSDNKLLIALAFPGIFPNLTKAALSDNPFNCQWFNATMNELKVRNVTISYETSTTCIKEKEVLEEFRSTMLSKQLEVLSFKFEKSSNNFNKVQDEQEKTIQECKSEIASSKQFQKIAMVEIDRLKHMVANLTEVLHEQDNHSG